jgi:hypothetical protein
MMHTEKTPVSEVLRNAEAQISRANDTRRRAAELYAQAARLQEEAYADAVAELGEEDGASTYRLACRSVGADPADRTGAGGRTPPSTVPTRIEAPEAAPIVPPVIAAQPAPVAPSPAEVIVQHPHSDEAVPSVRAPAVARAPTAATVAVPSPVHTASVPHEDPSRLERYGVLIKRSKLAEAEEVIAQALRTMSQNRKTNPYADDRGRNAWRNTLFAAVLAQGGNGDNQTPVGQVVTTEPEITGPVASVEQRPASASAYTSVERPADDGDPPSAVMRQEPVHDVLDDGLPSRSVPFTRNPAQSEIRETAVENRGGARQSPPFARPSGRVPQSVTPEVHVSRPIQNRPVGFGQAVPAPPGLSDTISRLNAGQQSHVSSPVTTPKPPSARPAPPFIRSK